MEHESIGHFMMVSRKPDETETRIHLLSSGGVSGSPRRSARPVRVRRGPCVPVSSGQLTYYSGARPDGHPFSHSHPRFAEPGSPPNR